MTSRNQQPGYYPYGHPLHAPAPVTARIDDVALVFEGGGMRGAYTGALVRALLEEGLEFGWVGGISAGGTNAVNMVTRDTWRAREAYLGMPLLGDAGGWGSFARGRGYFNSDRIYHHTSAEDEEMPVDWPALEASDVELVLGAFRCDTGEEVYFHRSDMPTPAPPARPGLGLDAASHARGGDRRRPLPRRRPRPRWRLRRRRRARRRV